MIYYFNDMESSSDYYIKESDKKMKFLILLISILFFSYTFRNREKFYITLTSWKARINFIHKNLENLLINKIKPKKIILNLALEEFPNKKSELPKEILQLLKKYKNFEIFWVKENNNVFKKLIPTLNRFKNDITIQLLSNLKKLINKFKIN